MLGRDRRRDTRIFGSYVRKGAQRAPRASVVRASDLVALGAVAPDVPIDHALAKNLASLPDLSDALRAAEPAIQRAVFDAFALRVECDRIEGNVKISATVDEAVATALAGVTDLPSVFCTNGHGGGRIRTSEGRAMWFTATPL